MAKSEPHAQVAPSPSRPAEADQVVFLHPQKTGGTALFAAMERIIRAGASRWGTLARDDLKARDIALIGSHNPLRDFPLNDGRTRLYVATIRHPGERLVSLYRYWRSMTWEALARQPLPAALAAKEMPLREWLSLEDHRPTIADGLVQHFCDDPEAEPAERLANAIANAARIDYFFLQTELYDDAAHFFAALGWPAPTLDAVNVTADNHAANPALFEAAEPIALDKATLHALDACTQLDRKFFEALRALRLAKKRELDRQPPVTRLPLNLREIAPGITINSRGLVRSPSVLTSGWAEPGEWHVWSCGHAARIMFRALPGVLSCVLKIHAQTPDLRPLLWGEVACADRSLRIAFMGAGAQIPIKIDAAAEPFLAVSNADPISLSVPLSKPFNAARDVTITLSFASLTPLADLGVNDDHRALGVALYSMQFSDEPARNQDLWRDVSPDRVASLKPEPSPAAS